MKKLSVTYFFGIDVSKKKLDFAFAKGLAFLSHQQIDNNYISIIAFIRAKLKAEKISIAQCCFCMEQTGIYCNHLIRVLLDLGAQFSVSHSAHIKLSFGLTRGKNDKVDAKRIAEFAYRFNDKLKPYKPKRAVVDELDTLCKLRKKLMKMKNQISVPLNELKSFGAEAKHKLYKSNTAKSLEAIALDIKSVTKAIRQLIKSDERLKELDTWIGSVVGVGAVTTPAVIVVTNEFTNGFSAKQMCSFCGVAPFTHQSGSSLNGKNRVSHKANKYLKTLLNMCAMSAIQTNSDLGRFYHRKLSEGKNKMSALNAVRNKIIHRIFAVVAGERKYERKLSLPAS